MRFYLGTHRPHWLALTDVPLFVSRRTLLTKDGALRKKLPVAVGPWALDSGGYTELSRGAWSVTPKDYAREVRRVTDEVGNLQWAAPMDWMCEPKIRATTGLTVEEHQARTVASFLELRYLLGGMVVPVLQGWQRDDYLRCVESYALAGVDLASEPIVGVGSICRRGEDAAVCNIVRVLQVAGVANMHAFGVRGEALARLAGSGALASADSMAWSFDASYQSLRRRKLSDRLGLSADDPTRKGTCGRKTCANCLHFALAWRDDRIASVQQLELAAA